jgi:hypothetical protein
MAGLYLGHQIPAYRAIIIAWGIEPFFFPFLDTDTVLSAVRCLREGVDVYVTNPCDFLKRQYDYSPAWMALTVFPMTLAWLPPIGLAVDLAFLASLLLLPAGRRWRDTAVIALGVISSASLFAVERGNNDLVLFVLAAGAAVLVCRSAGLRLVGYGLALLAGLLKYYPLALMAIAARERPLRLVVIAAASIAIVALFCILTWHDLSRALAIIPRGSAFGNMFGSITVGAGLASRRWSSDTAQAIRFAMSAAALAGGVILGLQPRAWPSLSRLSEQERSFLMVGALLILGCFFSAQNIGYRAVHLILVLPGLTALSAPGGRRLFRGAALAALALLWAEIWRNGAIRLGLHFSHHTYKIITYAAWGVRETLWWWLVTVLIAVVTTVLANSQAAAVSLAWLKGRRGDQPATT